MHLVMFLKDKEARAGVVDGEDVIDINACDRSLPATIKGILEANALSRVRKLIKSRKHRIPRKKARLLPPIQNPALLLSVGMNYHEHLEEMKTPVPEKPAAFTKSVASIIASGQPIVLPPAHPGMVDWEGEFTVVIGKAGHRIPAAKALDHVAGYTIANDVSARDWVAPIFASAGVMGPIHAWEHNLLGKMMPTFCPMGPCIATKDEVPDPDNVQIVTRLNGTVMQDANTDDLVFSVVKLIEYYSQFYRFLPGDCITTGSPSGVGYGRNPKVFMKPGDTISVEVKGVGILSNPVKAG
ncbi:MAG TPA: fumarylacetoacetate hydrolase family protein [Burkholderiales bacterium]|jgi:2-keto-4-pentenoate hydratase/2-oxohepta-3-ene-1,7-dioic acid hydratase in catechol pathway